MTASGLTAIQTVSLLSQVSVTAGTDCLVTIDYIMPSLRAFARVDEAVRQAQAAFSAALATWRRSYNPTVGIYSMHAWDEVVKAASTLGDSLRALGSTVAS